MNTNDKKQTTYELNFNLDEVSIYMLATGRDVTGKYYPNANNDKGLVGFWIQITEEVDNILGCYRKGILTVEPRRFARLLGELHRRAGRIERAECKPPTSQV